jgi:hypothetical protein
LAASLAGSAQIANWNTSWAGVGLRIARLLGDFLSETLPQHRSTAAQTEFDDVDLLVACHYHVVDILSLLTCLIDVIRKKPLIPIRSRPTLVEQTLRFALIPKHFTSSLLIYNKIQLQVLFFRAPPSNVLSTGSPFVEFSKKPQCGATFQQSGQLLSGSSEAQISLGNNDGGVPD